MGMKGREGGVLGRDLLWMSDEFSKTSLILMRRLLHLLTLMHVSFLFENEIMFDASVPTSRPSYSMSIFR